MVSFPIPEMWFRDDDVVEEDDPQIGTTAPHHTRYIMVGYLTSQLADDFIAQIQQLQRRHRDETDDDDHSHPLSRHDAAATLATAQLAHMFHCPVNDCRAALQHAMIFDWHDEDAPYIRGGYMHPLRGMTVQHLRDLAEPPASSQSSQQQRRLLLAGEATNANACCTLQAAMETGIRAARTILEEIHTTSTTTNAVSS